MNLLEQLQSHRGGLVQLKTELFWYEGRGWDNNPGRICLLLDAITADTAPCTTCTHSARLAAREATAVALLLIEGQPQWIWVVEQDVDLLVNDPPTN